ncbi:MAG: aminoacyl--tRNA ligase-related protein [Pseudonocardiaceae bacterium]
MIDIALLRTDPGLLRRTAARRGAAVDLDRIVELDTELRQASARSGVLRAQHRRHAMSREQVDVDAARALQEDLRAVAEQVGALQKDRDELWGRLPNLLPDDTPAGGSVEVRHGGDPVAAEETGGAEVAVEGHAGWRGDGARLAWAVVTHVQSLLLARGFTPMTTNQNVVGYYGDQIIDAVDLPIRVGAFAPCPRDAAGDADRGAYHAPSVEQVVLCRPEDAEHWWDECQRNIEGILRDLELPYRVLRVCAGDLRAAAYQEYETQSWFPGVGAYRKTHLNSHFTDYQTRGFKIRYLDRGRVTQPHSLAATAVTDRAMLAILENHVRPDGSVRIPEVLRPYLGGQKAIEPKAIRPR